MKVKASPLIAAVLFAVPPLAAQEPSFADARPEVKERATEMGQMARDQFEQKQFAGQVRKLRDGLAKGDFNKVAALQSTLLAAMRREAGQMRGRISMLKRAASAAAGEADISEKQPASGPNGDGQPAENRPAAEPEKQPADQPATKKTIAPAAKSRADLRRDLPPSVEEKEEQLLRMEQILAELQNFTFKGDNREQGESKLKLVDEFAQILHENMAEGFQQMGPVKPSDRH